jgi:hypothetical protein
MAIVTLKNASILEEQNALAFFTNCDDQMPNVKSAQIFTTSMLRRISKVETAPLASGCPLPSYVIDVCICVDPL